MDLIDTLDVISKLPNPQLMAKTCAREIRQLRRKVADLERTNTALQIGVKTCLDAERERFAKLKLGSPASTYTSKRIAMLEGLVQ